MLPHTSSRRRRSLTAYQHRGTAVSSQSSFLVRIGIPGDTHVNQSPFTGKFPFFQASATCASHTTQHNTHTQKSIPRRILPWRRLPWLGVACDGGSGARRRRGNTVVALTPRSLIFVIVTVFCCFVSPHQHHLVRHRQSSSSCVGINTIKKKGRGSFTVVVDDVRANCDVGVRE